MKADIAISNTKDPLNGRFTNARMVRASVVTIGTKEEAENRVDLVVQRDSGPYIRVRMDIEAAREVSDDLKAAIDRARAAPPSGSFYAFLVVKVQFHLVKGSVSAEVLTGSDDENEANRLRDDLEQSNTSDLPHHIAGVLYSVIPGRR